MSNKQEKLRRIREDLLNRRVNQTLRTPTDVKNIVDKYFPGIMAKNLTNSDWRELCEFILEIEPNQLEVAQAVAKKYNLRIK